MVKRKLFYFILMAMLCLGITSASAQTPSSLDVNTSITLTDGDFSYSTTDGSQYMAPISLPQDEKSNPISGFLSISATDETSKIFVFPVVNGNPNYAGVTVGLNGEFTGRMESTTASMYFLIIMSENSLTGVTITTAFTPDQTLSKEVSASDGYASVTFSVAADGYYEIAADDADATFVIMPPGWKSFADYIALAQGSGNIKLEKDKEYSIIVPNRSSKDFTINFTIKRILPPAAVPTVTEGTNTVDLPLVTSLNANYSFTPEHDGCYKFELSQYNKFSVMLMLTESAWSGANSVSYVEGKSTMIADGLKAGTTYYLLLGQVNSEDEENPSEAINDATLTVSYVGLNQLVYDSNKKTLTFTCDAEDHSGEGITLYTSPIKYSFSDNDISFKWQEDTETFKPIKENATKIIIDPSYAIIHFGHCKYFFNEFTNVKTIEGLKYLNTANVRFMYGMFKDCKSLTSLDLSGFNTENATCMNYMFDGCESLTSLDLSGFNTGNTKEMVCLFRGCASLTSLDLSSFNTTAVEVMDNMFTNCTNLESLTIGNFSDFVKGTVNVTEMFYNTPKLKTLILKALPSLEENTFDQKFCEEGATVRLELDDNSMLANYNCPSLTEAPTYTRTMPNQWGTIVLPFKVTLTGNEPYDFYKITSITDGELGLTKMTGEIPANTPALIRREGHITKVTITGSDNKYTIIYNDITADPVNGLILTGTCLKKDITAKDGYIIANNSFWNIQSIKGDNIVECNRFRAYLAGTLSNGAGAKQLSIGDLSDQKTPVEAIEALTSGTAEYYDLNGRRLNDLQKGVNIVKRGGKSYKVIIK